ncbi:DNA internalization-related competence protein ComEC/Rec2 [Peptoniphilus sp. ING2-D1G]|nr:DNA internalization-related competence protein ComEC/Rec2 [Peptoniphilus sp. ING2-D1G]
MSIMLLIALLLGVFVANMIKISSILCLCTIILLVVFYKRSDIKNRIYVSILIIFLVSIISVNFRNKNTLLGYVSLEGKIIQDFIDNENKFIFSDSYLNKYLIYSKEDLKIGDKVRIKGEIKLPKGKMNPYDFNYRNYLKAKGIDYIIYCDSARYLGKSFIDEVRADFREYVKSAISFLKEDNQRIVMSILLANTSYMDEMSKSDFRESGLSHVLAVSGLHICIILYVVETLLKLVRVSKIKRRLFAIILAFIYIYLIYFPIGALRSFFMFTILFMSFLGKKKYKPKDALILSAIITLLINPYAIYSPSFMLSYLSVLGILLFAKTIKSKMGSVYFKESIAITLSVSIMIIPISFYYFESYSILGIISNIFVLPIYTLAIILSYFMVIFKFAAPVISPAVDLILDGAGLLIKLINKLNFLNVNFYVGIFQVITYYLFLLLIIKRYVFIKYQAFNKSIFISSVLILIFSMFNYINKKDNFIMDFLYVDQAECTFIKNNKTNIMIDTAGSRDKNYRPGKIYTLNYLRYNSIDKIDYLFLTHFDEDHAEGLLDIIDEVEIKRAYVSYFEDNEYIKALLERGVDVYLVEKNDIINIDDNTTIEILSDSKNYRDANNKSMVFVLNHRGFKSLFTGDIYKEVEEHIYEDADLLKVAHHGSSTSSSDDFLKRTTPVYATISAGVDNYYNHPDEDVIKRLNENNILWKSTNYDGQITLKITDAEAEFTSYLEDRFKLNPWVVIGALLIVIFIYKFGDYFDVQRTLQRRYQGGLLILRI